MSTHQATDATNENQSPAVTVVVLVALVVAIYLAVTTLQDWNITGRVGFCIIVPGLVGAGLNALINAARD